MSKIRKEFVTLKALAVILVLVNASLAWGGMDASVSLPRKMYALGEKDTATITYNKKYYTCTFDNVQVQGATYKEISSVEGEIKIELTFDKVSDYVGQGYVIAPVQLTTAGTDAGEKEVPPPKVTFTVVKVEKIQDSIGGGAYQDMPNPLTVAKGTTVNFKAIPNPATATWPTNKPVWGGEASGTGETTSATFNTVSASATDYKTVTAECGNTITANILILTVEITIAPDWVLVYRNSNAPSTTATALGEPIGGTYKWTWSTKSGGTGRIKFAGTDTSSSVDIIGDLYSHPVQPDDVTLKVEYTLGGVTVEDIVDLTVRAMTATTSEATNLETTAAWFQRQYYHKIKDQYGVVISEIGIPVEEEIIFVEGDEGLGEWTGGAPTSDWGQYGISVRDNLKCRNTQKHAKREQKIVAGDWGTIPDYYIFFDPYEYYGTEGLWKEPK